MIYSWTHLQAWGIVMSEWAQVKAERGCGGAELRMETLEETKTKTRGMCSGVQEAGTAQGSEVTSGHCSKARLLMCLFGGS